MNDGDGKSLYSDGDSYDDEGDRGHEGHHNNRKGNRDRDGDVISDEDEEVDDSYGGEEDKSSSRQNIKQ